jgi:hypothetical protein
VVNVSGEDKACLDVFIQNPAGLAADVDVQSVIPGVGATNLGKAEDAVHASGDVGVMALAVRSDAGTLLAADGDYIPLSVNASGELRVTTAASSEAATVADGGALPAVVKVIAVDVLTLPAVTATDLDIRDLTHVGSQDSVRIGDGTDLLLITAAGEALVSLTTALPAGTNNIGDVDVLSLPSIPAGTNNIGDVDVLSVVPGTGATELGKAEDAAHSSGDVGVMALAVRSDAGGPFAADGDYVPLSTTATGALRVDAGTVATTTAANTAGTIVNTALTATTASSASAPANAVGFVLLAPSTNTDNVRWCIGSTASTTVGMLTEPGRDSGFIPCAATISVCATVSGTNAFSIQWIQSS